MKRFKIGFAAIIAILAISVTVASYAGAFKATKAAPAAVDCYTNVTYFNPLDNCASVGPLVINTSSCSPAINPVGKPAIATLPVDPQTQCDPVVENPVFCCAKILTGQPTLCGQTVRIQSITCKEKE